jgi:SARP family transcriptional regulator, regulator of embCAB operon
MGSRSVPSAHVAVNGRERGADLRIRLCGALEVDLDGVRVEDRLPSRQARALFALLVDRRRHALSREALIDALWGATPPPSRDASLRALLSGVRRVLGPDSLGGRGDVRIELPADTWVDVEVAAAAVDEGERALADGEPARARRAADQATRILDGGFLTGLTAPWIDERRGELEQLADQALELAAWAALAAGEPAAAERSARRLVERAPFREAGHEALMRALAEQGDVAEALLAHDHLRRLLRDELGAVPSAPVAELHRDLLAGGPSPGRLLPAAAPGRARAGRGRVPALRAGGAALGVLGAVLLAVGLAAGRTTTRDRVGRRSAPRLVTEATVRGDHDVSFLAPADWTASTLPEPGIAGVASDEARCNVFASGAIRPGRASAPVMAALARRRLARGAREGSGRRAGPVAVVNGRLPGAWATERDAVSAGRVAFLGAGREVLRVECRGPPAAWAALDRGVFRPLVRSLRVAAG